jgi:hypothetical protein
MRLSRKNPIFELELQGRFVDDTRQRIAHSKRLFDEPTQLKRGEPLGFKQFRNGTIVYVVCMTWSTIVVAARLHYH